MDRGTERETKVVTAKQTQTEGEGDRYRVREMRGGRERQPVRGTEVVRARQTRGRMEEETDTGRS